MNSGEITCDFDEFERCCELLAKRIKLGKGDAVAVLKARRRGAVYLAVLMESLKDIEVFMLNYQAEGVGKNLHFRHVGELPAGLRNKRVYLLTDIANTGDILSRAIKDLEEAGNEVIVCVIHYRIGSKVKPDIYIKEVDRHVRYSDWERARES